MKREDRRNKVLPARRLLSGTLWWVFYTLTILTALSLCTVCLFAKGGILAQGPSESAATRNSDGSLLGNQTQSSSGAASSPNTQITPPVLDSSQSKIGELEGRSSEMSKRIEEIGSHATQVLNVIGLLVGFLTAVVATGLWQSKQYMDRMVEHHKAEMKNFIREETEARLNELSSAVSDQFKRISIKTKEEFDLAVYSQKEILKALVQLESDNIDEVIAGCHTISAMQDRAYLPSLKRVLAKWSAADNTRAVEQVSAAYQRLLTAQQ